MPTKEAPKIRDAIVVKNLRKSYDKLKVLKDVSFDVKRGSILALLGPNGAGKTTTIKILSTLLSYDGGQATVNGYDVVKQADNVRSSIGLTGQYAAVDEYLTGRENLILIGRLYRMGLSQAQQRATKLLEQFDLVEAANRTVKTYSGGMRRRLDLAMSIIAKPPILILDEPTTGLDPRSRLTMWEIINQLSDSGTTILLTTQYMEEADRLADEIVVIDFGKVIARGTSKELKQKIGSERLEIEITSASDFDKAQKLIGGERLAGDKLSKVLSIVTKDGTTELRAALRKLDEAGVKIAKVSLHQPTLDDVFLTLTGKGTDQEGTFNE